MEIPLIIYRPVQEIRERPQGHQVLENLQQEGEEREHRLSRPRDGQNHDVQERRSQERSPVQRDSQHALRQLIRFS